MMTRKEFRDKLEELLFPGYSNDKDYPYGLEVSYSSNTDTFSMRLSVTNNDYRKPTSWTEEQKKALEKFLQEQGITYKRISRLKIYDWNGNGKVEGEKLSVQNMDKLPYTR